MLGLFLAGCSGQDAKSDRVDASDHDAFWLWAGVKPQPILDQAQSVYILGAELRASNADSIDILRPTPPEVNHTEIWLVVRLETLDLGHQQYQALIDLVGKWASVSDGLIGIQLDFDSQTRGLEGYASFLRNFRRKLPERYQLGVTGLLDWSANGDPTELKSIAAVVDETVFQTYQGRHTIAGYEKWLRNLDDLPMPFRIGLVQHGEWRAPDGLQYNPNFEGYVVFLLNPEN